MAEGIKKWRRMGKRKGGGSDFLGNHNDSSLREKEAFLPSEGKISFS